MGCGCLWFDWGLGLLFVLGFVVWDLVVLIGVGFVVWFGFGWVLLWLVC